MLTFHILNVYVDNTQPRQFKFTLNFIYRCLTHSLIGNFLLDRIRVHGVTQQCSAPRSWGLVQHPFFTDYTTVL